MRVVSSFSRDQPAGAPEDRDDLQTNWEETVESFDAMELREELLRGIYAYGFEKPSAIQQRAVKPILMGEDVIAQAQSGKHNWRHGIALAYTTPPSSVPVSCTTCLAAACVKTRHCYTSKVGWRL